MCFHLAGANGYERGVCEGSCSPYVVSGTVIIVGLLALWPLFAVGRGGCLCVFFLVALVRRVRCGL